MNPVTGVWSVIFCLILRQNVYSKIQSISQFFIAYHINTENYTIILFR